MRHALRRVTGASLVLASLLAGPVAADDAEDCLGPDNERRIAGCTRLIDVPDLASDAKSLAHAMRALAYSLRGQFRHALPDYDRAIALDPRSAVALNNRAWTLYKLRRAQEGLFDVERSLDLSPASPHAHDTRAHINQVLGRPSHALGDYERAMSLGGARLVQLYQCGLREKGLYRGRIDGFYSHDLRRALEACVLSATCDPLPADEECRNLTS
jgi:tetratricopeptide (TPR) repeat protein